MALNTAVHANVNTVSEHTQQKTDTTASFAGQTGIAETVLRPAGKVRLAGQTFDAVTEGGFIEAGAAVIVLRSTGKSLTVRSVQTPA